MEHILIVREYWYADVCHHVNPSHIRGRKQTVSYRSDGFAGGKPGYVARHMVFRTGEYLVRRVGDLQVFLSHPGSLGPTPLCLLRSFPIPASMFVLSIAVF
jgi:hypothetical protein